MAQIGTFTQRRDGFAGRLQTLTFCCDIFIVPAEPSGTDNAPDYRVHLGPDDGAELGPEIGAGWKRTGERAGAFIALILDDPALVQPIRANLFRDGADGTTWSLQWNRLHRRDARD